MTPRKRISTGQKWALLAAAFFTDTLSLIPILNIIVVIFAWFIFWLWFALLRVNRFNRANRFAIVMTATVIESIPIISMFPAWLWSTYRIIKDVQEKDDEHNEKLAGTQLLPNA